MIWIKIRRPGGTLDPALSAEVCVACGLDHAFVFRFSDRDGSALRRRLEEAIGGILMDLLTYYDALGFSRSRALSRLAATRTALPPCLIVQLIGAVPLPEDQDLLEVIRSVAWVGGGRARIFNAPMIVDSAEAAAAIHRQPYVERAFILVPPVTLTVVVIGA